jgi:hypothetical protein
MSPFPSWIHIRGSRFEGKIRGTANGLIKKVLGSTLPVKERVFNDGGVTFRGEIGGHAFEETDTVQVRSALPLTFPLIFTNNDGGKIGSLG